MDAHVAHAAIAAWLVRDFARTAPTLEGRVVALENSGSLKLTVHTVKRNAVLFGYGFAHRLALRLFHCQDPIIRHPSYQPSERDFACG